MQYLDPNTADFVAPATTTITSPDWCIYGDNSKNWQLTNSGSITGNQGPNPAVSYSSASVGASKLDNFGSIISTTSSAIFLQNGGTASNHLGGKISSAGGTGVLAEGLSLVNDGAISGSSGGIRSQSNTSITQSATGTVSSTGGPGILVDNGPITINNAGSITSAASFGLFLRGTSTGTVTNTGTISGVPAGVILQGTGSVTLINAGTITGTSGTAVSIASSNNRLILQTGSALNGAVTSTGTNNTLALQGTGSANNTFSGFSTLSALDTGTWTLSGNVATSAASASALNVQNGTLIVTGRVTNGGAGAGSSVSNGGTLQIGDGGTTGSVSGNLVTDSSAQVRFNRSDDLTYADVVSGAGGLTQAGPGSLMLTGSNTYTGTTAVTGGAIVIGHDNALGNTALLEIAAGAIVAINDKTQTIGALGGGGVLGLRGGNLVISNGGAFSGTISGASGTLTNNGGILLLTGNNTYTGAMQVAAGTLQIGDGGTAGSYAGSILNSGAVVFERNNMSVYPGTISGIGSVTQAGTGTTVFTGNNTYSGGTTIAAGTLQVGNGGITGGIAGNVANNGALAFSRADRVQFDGVISGAGSVMQAGSGNTILTGNNTYSGGTTIAAGTLQIGNGGTSGSIAGNVTNNGALAFNRTDTLQVDRVISGTGSVTQAGTGELIFNGTQPYSGATTVTAGTLIVGDGAHPAAALSGGGTVTVGSPGALGGYGTVTGSVINEGLIGVGNALPALANGPDASFTILGNLDNRGTISMSNHLAGDRMIVSGGQYTSNGGRVLIDTVLNEGGAASNSDVLVAGSTVLGAKGATQLAITNVGGAGSVTTGDGIEVVQVQDATRSAAGAFKLLGRAVAGAYEYQLLQGGKQSADGNWYLRSERDPVPPDPPTPPTPPTPPDPPVPPDPPTPPDPPAPPTPPTPPSPPTPPAPLYRPEVAAYLANQRVAGQMFVQSLDDRGGNGSPGSNPNANSLSTLPGDVWLRVQGRTEGSNSHDGVFSVDTDSYLMQGGVEAAQMNLINQLDLLHLGLMATYMTARSNADAAGNSAHAKGNVEGYSVGAYGTWYQSNATRLGAYADTWMQYGWFNNNVEGDELPTVKYDAHGWAVSGELGYAVPLVSDWVVMPQAQLIYVKYREDSLTEPNGTNVNGADSTGVVTRLGLRLQRNLQFSAGRKAQFYLTANWWHTNTSSTVSFNELPVGGLYPDNRYEMKLGVNGNLGKQWTAWSTISGAWGAQSYHEYILRIGARYAW